MSERKNCSIAGTLNRRSLLRTAGSGLVGIAGFSGIESVAASGRTAGEGHRSIEIAQSVEPDHDYDPVVTEDDYTVRIVEHVFEGLYEYDASVGLVPRLAASDPEIENDGTRIVLEVRNDATFHNGDPVTGEDIVHSFTAPVVEGTFNERYFEEVDVESSAAIDERTAKIDLSEPHAPFLTSTVTSRIVNKQERIAAQGFDDEEEWKNHDHEAEPRYADSSYNTSSPIGTGPYKYVNHVEGEQTILERWDDYWGDLDPLVDEIRWTAIEDDDSRISSVREGSTAVAADVPGDEYPSLVADPDVDIETTTRSVYFYLAYNCNEGPTTDPDVRNGIEYAFSVDAFVQEHVFPAGSRAVAPVPAPVSDAWDFPTEEYADRINGFDPATAADLLDGNVPDGWSPRFICPPDRRREALLEQVAEGLRQLSEYGLDIDPTVDRLDWGSFIDAYLTGNADDYLVYALGWGTDSDPDGFLWPLFHAENAGEFQGHYYGEAGDEFHSKIRNARETIDRDQRVSLYDDVISELLENTVHTPAYSLNASVVHRSELEPPEAHPNDTTHLRTVSEQGKVAAVRFYQNENGRITTDALRSAVADWRNGRIETETLQSVIDAW